MGKSKILGGGAGNVVNGIIEQYYAATDDVKANTFVEYVKKFELDQPTNVAELTTDSMSAALSVARLSDTKVFVAYTGVVSSYYAVYGIVCTISNGIITPGTVVNISSNISQKIQYVDVVMLDSTKVAVVYSTDMGSSAKAYAQICAVSGTTISTGSPKEIGVGTGNFGATRATPLTNSTFAVMGQSGNLYVLVCSVSGTTVTVGSNVIVRNSSVATQVYFSISTLTSNKVIVSYAGEPTNSILHACVRVCTISGTNITAGTQYAQATMSGYTVYSKIVAISETKAILLAGNYLDYVVVCTIAGTAVTFGTTVSIGSSYYGGELIAFSDHAAGVVRPIGSGLTIGINLLQIAGTVITFFSKVVNFMSVKSSTFSYRSFQATLYKDTHFVLAGPYGSSSNPSAQTSQLFDYEGIIPLTTTENFLGLTTTKATKTSQGKVWTLKGE